MIKYTPDGFNLAKSGMAREFNKAITDAEGLSKTAADVSGDGTTAAAASLQGEPVDSGTNLADASRAAVLGPLPDAR